MQQTVVVPMGSDAKRIFTKGMPQKHELSDFFDQPDLKFSGQKELVVCSEVNLGYSDNNIFKKNGLSDYTVGLANAVLRRLSHTRAIMNHGIHAKFANHKKRLTTHKKLSELNPKITQAEENIVTVFPMYNIAPRITFVEYSLSTPDCRDLMFDHILSFFHYVDQIRTLTIASKYYDFVSKTDIMWNRPVLAHRYNEVYMAIHADFCQANNIPEDKIDFSLHYDDILGKTVPTFVMGN